MLRAPLENTMEPADLRLLRDLGAIASQRGTRLWLVGGPVRDALLGRPVVDLDLTSAKPAEELGAALADACGGSVVARSQFGTVKLRFGRQTVDLATARSESYARPGALPTVARGDLLSDLARRDFSINAMAASLSEEDFGEVLDTEGGQADLHEKKVRVLHDDSFSDDPTRMLRAVRYATRLGFHMDRHTKALLRRDLPLLDRVSSSRIHRELDRMLEEPTAPRVLAAADKSGVLRALHRAMGGQSLHQALGRARRANAKPQTLLGVLTYGTERGKLASLTK